MEKTLVNVNEIEMEMITLTEDEKKYVESLENNLAGGAGAGVVCICVS